MTPMIIRELAQYIQNAGLGIYSTADPSLRTIYTGELPQGVNEGLYIIMVPSPPPHQYITTEYTVVDFWYRSAKTDRAYEQIRNIYNLFHRRSNWDAGAWHVFFSQALGSIMDMDRDAEGGKLLRLSVQFISRDLNSVS